MLRHVLCTHQLLAAQLYVMRSFRTFFKALPYGPCRLVAYPCASSVLPVRQLRIGPQRLRFCSSFTHKFEPSRLDSFIVVLNITNTTIIISTINVNITIINSRRVPDSIRQRRTHSTL